ncbi:MAG: TonB-dependent receptor plug domain-containing protein [Bacteroidetes bacterium]|nr:TonB-dependent receptor plug domain-containing protein [Bacteroidota bacterium]
MSCKHLAMCLGAVFLLFSTKIIAQDMANTKIKVTYVDEPLDLVFLNLKLSYGLNFEYSEAEVKGIRLSMSTPKLPVNEAMMMLLQGTGLTFELKPPKTIVIFKDKNFGKTDLDPSEFEVKNRNITVSGTIKDKASGETLPYASVQVRGTTLGNTTNGDGYFTIQGVPTDTAILEISYLGYHTRYFRLTPENVKQDFLIEMTVIGEMLQEVVIVAEKEDQLLKASSGISTIGITPAAVASLPSYGEKDIFRSLQLLPGVSGSNESSSGLYVRGGTPDQNLVLFDEFTVYHVDHLFGFFSAFNSNAIKDVQLYKGGFDAKYGGRLSSVVELTGKDGNTERLNMGLGLSLLSVNGYVEAPFADGKGSFLVAGRRSFQSKFYSNLFDDFTNIGDGPGGSTNTGGGSQPGPPGGGRGFGQQEVQPTSYFYDLNAKATYRPSKKDIVFISFYNGKDNLDNSRDANTSAFGNRPINFNFQRESVDLTNWGNWGTAVKWSRRWNDHFYSNANISYSNYFSKRDRHNSTTITREDSTFTISNGNFEYNNLKDYTLKLDNEWQLSHQNQLEFGAQATYNDIRYKYTQNDTLNVLNRTDKGLITSAYLQDRHTFNDKLILKGGLRMTHYGVTGKIYTEPRASLTYLLTDRIKLKAAWGKYRQFATRIVREDIQQGSRDFWLLANDENVPIGAAMHHIAGASYETSTWLFDVEAYYKNLDGLSEYTTRFTPSGFGPNSTLDYEEFFYTGTGKAKGVELLTQKKIGKLTGWLGYTLGEVLYDFDAFGDKPFHANQDVTHEVKLVGNYKLGQWAFGATFIYATGKPYTAPTGFYQVNLLDGSTADFFEVSGKNAFRLPAYHRVDISATYDFRLGRSKANLGLSLFNIYNRKNTWYKEYEVVEGELLETNVSLLGLTPSLFFNWTLR